MIRPVALDTRPSLLMVMIGGGVATLLLCALTYLAPALGFPWVPVPYLVGGVFIGNVTAAFWIGCVLFFLVGWLVFAPLFHLLWGSLPGDGVDYRGALWKGIVFGVALWVASGLLLPVLGWLNRLEGLGNPGGFALSYGVLGALGTLLGHLAYGIALALIAATSRGISPLSTMGWMGYRAGRLNHETTTSTYGS